MEIQLFDAALSKLETLLHTRRYLRLLEKNDMDEIIKKKISDLPFQNSDAMDKEHLLDFVTRLAKLRPQLEEFKIYTGVLARSKKWYISANLSALLKPRFLNPYNRRVALGQKARYGRWSCDDRICGLYKGM